LAQRGVINDVIDCSFESSDDATVTILAQPRCQDAMKRLALYGNAVLAIRDLPSGARRSTANLN